MPVEENSQGTDPGFPHEDESVVVATRQLQEDLGLRCRFEQHFAMAEGDDLVIRAVGDQHRATHPGERGAGVIIQTNQPSRRQPRINIRGKFPRRGENRRQHQRPRPFPRRQPGRHGAAQGFAEEDDAPGRYAALPGQVSPGGLGILV